MTRIAHIGGGSSKLGGAMSCTTLPLSERLMRVARAVWPRKTAAELSATTGRSERMCKYWLARKFGLSADDLASIIKSEHGLEFLHELMADAAPNWWAEFKTGQEIALLRRQQEIVRSRLESLERAQG